MKKIDQNSRYDFPIIENWTHQNSKVLDLGCGDGSLLNYLKEKKDIKGFGIEKNKDNWLLSLKNNIDVIQMDLEAGLAGFETNSFDLVILSRTIQSMNHIEEIIMK
jgi:methionine biosynthesis protein MetW